MAGHTDTTNYPDSNIYRYKVTAKFISNSDTYDIDTFNIKSVVIDNDYDKNNMPLLYMTASLDRKLVDMMVQNQDNAKIILDIKRCIINSDMPSLYEDYIVSDFIYFITNDINKNDEYDFEGNNEGREDLFRIVTFGLMSIDMINKNKRVINGVITGKLSSIMYWLVSHMPVVVEPPTTNKKMVKMIMPPIYSVSKSLEYVNSLQTFYDTGYRYYVDFDCTYLISRSGKAVPKQGESITGVMITLKSSHDERSKLQGMLADEKNSMYQLEIDGIDCELNDGHLSDKSYVKIKSTNTSGKSNNTELSGNIVGSVINKKDRHIRVLNDNDTLMNNLKVKLDDSAIQLAVQKTDIDPSVLTINKEYTVKADEVYKTDEYNGKYLVTRKRELLIREDEDFRMATMLLMKKIQE